MHIHTYPRQVTFVKTVEKVCSGSNVKRPGSELKTIQIRLEKEAEGQPALGAMLARKWLKLSRVAEISQSEPSNFFGAPAFK